MQYHFLRIFLTRDEIDLFSGDRLPPPKIQREDFLRNAFSEQIGFRHRRESFVFKPLGTVNGFIVAAVARKKQIMVNDGPESNFQKKKAADWPVANLFIDARDYNDGQKIALQLNKDVGMPIGLMRSLISRIPIGSEVGGWKAQVQVLSSDKEFWATVQQYKGKITEASFTFLSPNVFRSKAMISKVMKGLHNETNISQVDVVFRDKFGNLNLEVPRIHNAYEYIERGGGRSLLKSGRRSLFDSEQNVLTENMASDIDVESSTKEMWMDFIKRLFKL